MSTESIQRSGFCALVGKPNAGKSTLVNALLGEKVAIVSPKPQTTRTRIHGILSGPDGQVIFVDTPGLCDRGNALRKMMRKVAGNAASESDIALVIAAIPKNPREPTVAREDSELVRWAREAGAQVLVALNKVDRLQDKRQVLPWIETYARELDVETVIPISALKGDGVERIVEEVKALLPEGPPLFPTDLHTDQAERFLCEELIREQLLMRLQQEVPHSAAVVIESFDDQRNDEDSNDGPGLVRLEGKIVVERESQKAIVIGKGGKQIKAVSEAARKNIEDLVGAKVFLRMQVSVDPLWTRDRASVQRYGIGNDG